MKILIKCLLFIALISVLFSCSVVSPYLDKAAEMSVETSTKTLQASVYYQCDRARIGDLIRRYPDMNELMSHINWCLSQSQKKQYVAPKVN
jgi:hypothetical protein